MTVMVSMVQLSTNLDTLWQAWSSRPGRPLSGGKQTARLDVENINVTKKLIVRRRPDSPFSENSYKLSGAFPMQLRPVTAGEGPKGFNFQTYALDAAGSHHQGVMRIELRIEAAAAEHLLETPLSRVQKVVATKDPNWMRLTATVANDDALRWWLLGFGAQIEVLKPASLRREIKAESQAMARRYA